MSAFAVGQRFVSEAEPELGLGRVEGVEGRQIVLHFPASETTRRYAVGSAPIKRVSFRIGDEVSDEGGRTFRIDAIEERDGLYLYCGDGRRLPESDLSSRLSFSKPDERLAAGMVDRGRAFDLRYRSLVLRHRALRSRARGFLGARIELMPHQLYISQEVANRPFPRALLADEVGLGKTIEAGLVVHRLLRSGQMSRVLILVPEALVHQWFVELYRRFHLSFTLVDESYCRAFEVEDEDEDEDGGEGVNPFLQTETAIVSLSFLSGSPARRRQAESAGWDMVVVDEAHHLKWSEEAPSPAYELVAHIAAGAPGVLLLTATPEQLGEASHFARLKLLDPHRYESLARYREEAAAFHEVARIAGKLIDGVALDEGEAERLWGVTSLEELVDRHGPGRVVFRNARRVLEQFPARRVHAPALSWPAERTPLFEKLGRELVADLSLAPPEAYDYGEDPRVQWLLGLLREIEPEKVLVICRYKEKAVAIYESLRRSAKIGIGLFHEELSLRERDRNAAWFAEPEGARALICSEIGSEGRNFQFAHHLVLFDLPASHELLEQRIGRLYRIGQHHTVEIHVPFLSDSPQELLFRWYHEGLDAFETSPASGAFFDELSERLVAFALALARGSFDGEAFDAFLEETRAFHDRVLRELEEGRDRLLELASFRPDEARALIETIRDVDASLDLDRWLESALDYLGVELDPIGPRTYVLRQTSGLVVDTLPGLRADEVGMTADRDRATHQGELDFLTWDHPMVSGVMELLLGAEHGNSALALLPSEDGEEALLLEALFVLEVVAPPELYVDRFLPPTPLRIVVDHDGHEVTGRYPGSSLAEKLREETFNVDGGRLSALIASATRAAEREAPSIVGASLDDMRATMAGEVRRLEALRAVNDHVRPEEIEKLEAEVTALSKAIESARLRLDALRLVWKTANTGTS